MQTGDAKTVTSMFVRGLNAARRSNVQSSIGVGSTREGARSPSREKAKEAKLKFSRKITAKMRLALANAWKNSTMEKYLGYIKRFQAFNRSEGIAEEFWMPANEQLLCAFAASFAGELSGATAHSAMAAVRAWHILQGEKWAGGLNLSYILKGVTRMTPDASKLDPRPPTTIDMIECLDSNLDQEDAEDACLLFGVKSGFWGQIRGGELMSDRVTTYTVGDIPLVSDVHEIPGAPNSRLVHLPNTKCGGIRGEDVILCAQVGSTNPVLALENHLKVNRLPANAPLMSFRDKEGRIKFMTKRRMFDRANEIWSKHGFVKTSGHSLRIGGTTQLLLSGVPPDIVKTMGRWKSDAFLVYWRAVQIIVPSYGEYLDLRRSTKS